MRAVLQRVRTASAEVNEKVVGSIGAGILLLLGISRNDTDADAVYLLRKVLNLRIFPDEAGKMNRSLIETQGGLLIISQFTLYGDCSKGRRPSFDLAAPPERAKELYDFFVAEARKSELVVETGIFQAMMNVRLENDGPVTVIIESA